MGGKIDNPLPQQFLYDRESKTRGDVFKTDKNGEKNADNTEACVTLVTVFYFLSQSTIFNQN